MLLLLQILLINALYLLNKALLIEHNMASLFDWTKWWNLASKHRWKLYYLTLEPKIIKSLKLDRLCNTINIIFYSFLYILVSDIKKYWNKSFGDYGIGNTTVLQTMLIYLRDKKVGDRPSSFFGFASTLIIFSVNFSQL